MDSITPYPPKIQKKIEDDFNNLFNQTSAQNAGKKRHTKNTRKRQYSRKNKKSRN